MSLQAHRQLLFAILAFQLDFIDRPQMLAGFDLWVKEKSSDFGDILRDLGFLTAARLELLQALVREHLQQHGDDPEKSLAAVSSLQSVRHDLNRIPDADLQRSLSLVPMESQATERGSTVTWLGEQSEVGQRFKVLRPHAKGGLGQVSVALDTELNREVALKEIQDSHADNPAYRARFLIEAEITGGLEHPGIVPVYGLGTYGGGRPFYAMKFVKGNSLKEAIARFHAEPSDGGPVDETARNLQLRELLRRFTDVCNAMTYAHSRGVLHRDLKPGNILLGKYGETLVVDWGLAKSLEAAAPDTASELPFVPRTSLSGTPAESIPGHAVGTPDYMSPEQAAGRIEDMGPATDVYSLGATLYHLLTGVPPFAPEPDHGQIIQRAQRGDFPAPRSRNNRIPAGLDAICRKALSLKPADRYRSPRDLALEIEHWLADEPLAALPDRVPDRIVRLARRHRAWFSASVAALLLIATVSAISTLVVNDFRKRAEYAAGAEKSERAKAVQLAAEKATLAQEMTDLAVKASDAANSAQEARRRTEVTLADVYTANALLANAAGDSGTALLWSAEAAKLAPDDQKRHSENRLRAENALNAAIIPVAAKRVARGPYDSIQFQPGGNLLMITDSPHFEIWDWGRDETFDWASQLKMVNRTRWSPDGRAVAVGFGSGDVEIRDTQTGEVLGRFAHTGAITAIAFSRDGELLAVASDVVRIWNIRKKTFLSAGWKHPNSVHSLVFNGKGERLVTACNDGSARLFPVPSDATSFAPLNPGLVHMPVVPSPPVFVDSDRGVITIINPQAGQLGWWDVETGKLTEHGKIQAIPWTLMRVGASRDGAWFGTAGRSAPQVWTVGNPTCSPIILEHRHSTDLQAIVDDFDFSPDGKVLLSASRESSTVWLWSIATGKSIGYQLPHSALVVGCRFATDGTTFATIQEDGLIRIWKRPRFDAIVQRLESWGHTARLSFDGTLATPGYSHELGLNALDQNLNQLRVIEVAGGRPVGPPIAIVGQLVDSCICTDNRSVAIVSHDKGKGFFAIHDVRTGSAVFPPVSLSNAPQSVAARPGRPQVAVLCVDGKLSVYDTRDASVLQKLTQENWPSAKYSWPRAQYTPDGSALLTVTSGFLNSVIVRNAETGELRFDPIQPVLEGGPCRGIAISADSRMLATFVNGKNAAQIWELESGQPLSDTLLHPGARVTGLNQVVFSADRQQILSVGADGVLRYWDWKTGQLLCPPMKHDHGLRAVAVTTDKRHALACSQDNVLHIWELITGREVAAPIQAIQEIVSVTVSPDGTRVLLGGTANEGLLIDLTQILEQPQMPTDDLVVLGELTTSRRVQQGASSTLSSAEWLEKWLAFRERHPEFGKPQRMAEGLAAQLDAAVDQFTQTRITNRAAHWSAAFVELLKLRPKEATLNAAQARHAEGRGLQQMAAEYRKLATQLYEDRLKDRPDDSEAANGLADVFADIHESENQWIVLDVEDVRSSGGATFKVLPDRSVLVSGINPDTDLYTVRAKAQVPRITALRLEVIPDPSLPFGASGRSPINGNFTLGEVSASIISKTEAEAEIPVAIDAAISDITGSQNRSVQLAIDGVRSTHWTSFPNQAESHFAVFRFRGAGPTTGSTLVIRLDTGVPGWGQHGIGRFRLSVTADPAVFHIARDRVISLRTTSPWARLGFAYALRRQFPEAAKYIAKALSLVSATATPNPLAAAIRDEAARDDETFKHVVDRRPDDSDLWVARAAFLASVAHWQDAITAATTAIQLNPRNADAYRSRAWIQATAADGMYRDGRQAIADATRARQLTQWDGPLYLEALAAAHAELGDFEEAVKCQTKAAEGTTDKNAKNGVNLRLMLYKAGKPYGQDTKAPSE